MTPWHPDDSGTSRLNGRDLLRASSTGLRARQGRAALCALGIGIGVAIIVATLGISQSSKSALLNEQSQLANLLTAQPGNAQPGTAPRAELPATAESMVSRMGAVTGVSEIASIPGTYVYRTPSSPAAETNGIALTAADASLPATLGASLAHGTFLNQATARYPAVVLGAETARLLAITKLASHTQVWIGGHWFTVVGILNPVQLTTELDRMAFIGFPVAEEDFGFDGHPTELYLRSDLGRIRAVYDALPANVNPAAPLTVQPGRPADAIQAELNTKASYERLFLALGAIALLLGAIGLALVMIISILERRSEIGLRRAMGATRRHVAGQFLTEAALLSVLGGVAGTIVGVVGTAIYARTQHWQVQFPALALYGGIVAALLIGVIAGLYPALRAARQSPAQALRTA